MRLWSNPLKGLQSQDTLFKALLKVRIQRVFANSFILFKGAHEPSGVATFACGVPAKLGKNGIEEIIELKLNTAEMDLMNTSAKAVLNVMDVLDKQLAAATTK